MSSRCWLCDWPAAKPWGARGLERSLTAGDLRITDSHYGTALPLLQCLSCGFIFAPGAEADRLGPLIESVEDEEYVQSQDARSLQMRWLLRLARKWRPEARSLLDVGAAAGLLVREARESGLQAAGIEPSAMLVHAAMKVNRVDLVRGFLPHAELTGQQFDLVCLIDVIEHTPDPLGLLRSAAAHASQNALLIVATPDISSLTARMMGKRWWHVRPAHVGYFARRTLQEALTRAGFRVLAIERRRWYFQMGYLLERTARYLPFAPERTLARVPGARRLLNVIVPMSLPDSIVALAQLKE